MEKFLKLTLDALTDNVIVLENNGLIIYANKAWKQFAIDNGVHFIMLAIQAARSHNS